MTHPPFKFYLEVWLYMRCFNVEGHAIVKTGFSEYRLVPQAGALA